MLVALTTLLCGCTLILTVLPLPVINFPFAGRKVGSTQEASEIKRHLCYLLNPLCCRAASRQSIVPHIAPSLTLPPPPPAPLSLASCRPSPHCKTLHCAAMQRAVRSRRPVPLSTGHFRRTICMWPSVGAGRGICHAADADLRRLCVLRGVPSSWRCGLQETP